MGIWALAPFLQNAHATASYVNASDYPSNGFAQPVSGNSDIAGTYVGTLYDNIAGSGNFTVTILRNGNKLSGTWAVQFSSRWRYNNSGEIEGVLMSPTSAAFYLMSSVSTTCPYLATVVVEAGQLKGTYASHNCTLANGGSLTASK